MPVELPVGTEVAVAGAVPFGRIVKVPDFSNTCGLFSEYWDALTKSTLYVPWGTQVREIVAWPSVVLSELAIW